MRTLESISLFQKGMLLLKTRFYSLRARMQMAKIDFDHDYTVSPRLKFPLVKFDHPMCLVQWGVKSDQEFGGDSEGKLSHVNGKCLRLEGNIDTKDKNRLADLPCLGIELKREVLSVNIRRFNMINLKVKTNGDPYRILIRTRVPWVG